MSTPASVVSSYNEWDPLEEVIVGAVANAMIPAWDEIDDGAHSRAHYATAFADQGKPMPKDDIDAATRELAHFAEVLQKEGVKVRRPDPIDFAKAYATPDWKWPCGFNSANPRDVLLVAGNDIIEAATPRKSRVFEVLAYRSLLREYSRAGARWTSAPRPSLTAEAFDPAIGTPRPDEPLLLRDDQKMRYPHTEWEPLWEAADFMRCGRDWFYHRSFVTNQFGVEWLQRHVGPEVRFHEIDTRCRRPVHIDTTFVPLAPGKALANPEFAPRLPEVLKKWDVLYAPPGIPRPDYKSPYKLSSNWLSMNVFSIDEERVIIDSLQEPLIAKLKDWGFKPIPIPFQRVYPFGGGLHCATLDVRRKGELKSYF